MYLYYTTYKYHTRKDQIKNKINEEEERRRKEQKRKEKRREEIRRGKS